MSGLLGEPRRNLGQSAFARKIERYAAAISAGCHTDWWGVPNLHVLTITTSMTHARRLLEHIAARVPIAMQGLFAVACDTQFGADWRVPEAVLSQLLTERWSTALGPRLLQNA